MVILLPRVGKGSRVNRICAFGPEVGCLVPDNPPVERPAKRTTAFWLIAGLLVGLLIQGSQARLTGNWTGLLAGGSDSPLLPVLQRELPGLVVTEGEGHDGQSTYAVALDPFLLSQPPVVPEASYRYRRILLPLLGSGFGAFDGYLLLGSLTTVNLIGFAIACWGAALVAQARNLPPWFILTALLNMGLWLSLQTTTPDALAFGSGILAVALATWGRHSAAAVFVAAAGLGKETYVLIGFGLAIWAWRRLGDGRIAIQYCLALLPAALWSGFLAMSLGEGFATGGNLSAPLAGILTSAQLWPGASARDQLFTAIALIALSAAIAALVIGRASIWKFLLAPWVVLALVSSHWIWDLGNNSLRALAPLFTFSLFGLFDRGHHQVSISRKNLPV